jgi:nucleotide-binding universal stress UspA family protein
LFAPNRIDVDLFHVATKIPESFWDIEKDPASLLNEAAPSASGHQQEKEIQELMERARQLFVDRGVPKDAVIAKIQERQVGIARDIIYESERDYNAVVVGIATRMATGVLSRAGAIIEEALKWGYGTIVVGRRGLSHVEEFSMGRVSNKIIHMAKEMAVWVVS